MSASKRVATILCAAAGCLLAGGGATAEGTAAPAPDPPRQAEEALRRAEKELADLEAASVGERVNARLAVLEKEARLSAWRREQAAGGEVDAAEARKLEALLRDVIERSVAGANLAQVKAGLEAKVLAVRKR